MSSPGDPAPTPLSGWAGYPQVETSLIPLHQLEPLRADAGPCAIRGNGRAYGDAAALAAGRTYSSLPQDRFLEFDRERGILRAEAGVTIAEILDVTVPAGWFLPVVPGTRHATLGGCIAADVHGKNHWTAGSFSRCVSNCALLLADGREILVSPESSPEIFWATCGGMGLTGYIRHATVRLERIETMTMISVREPCADLEASLASLIDTGADFPHSAVWIDGFATGRQLGRGVISRTRHARADEVPAHAPYTPLSVRKETGSGHLESFRTMLLPKIAVRVFNTFYRATQTRRRAPVPDNIAASFFPLDAVNHWNRLYGERGFIQCQIALPERVAAASFRDLLEQLHGISSPPYLVVLKRFGDFPAGPLSFPLPGFTLAADLPRTSPDLPSLLDAFDERVASLGGRVYLAKDSRMKPDAFAAMYPHLEAWRKIKQQIDPDNRFQTELGRRLRLCA